jgi:hypothetical protein
MCATQEPCKTLQRVILASPVHPFVSKAQLHHRFDTQGAKDLGDSGFMVTRQVILPKQLSDSVMDAILDRGRESSIL